MQVSAFTTDWLNSKPVFYNEYTGKISRNINDVIDYDHVEIHPEGLYNYLDFGYVVFGQTPVKGVKFLPPNARIHYAEDAKKLEIHQDKDDVPELLDRETKPEDVLKLIEHEISKWKESIGEHENILIPLSGGYDSRLLISFFQQDERVTACTFTNNYTGEQNFEMVFAKEVAQRVNVAWKGFVLKDYLKYLDEWNALFGVSTHAHGMHQIEFFRRVSEDKNQSYLISGIIGGPWGGGVDLPSINSPSDLNILGVRHQLHADPEMSMLPHDFSIRTKYFEEHKEDLANPAYRVVEHIRIKIMLLRYLLLLPEYMGLKPWSPYLNKDVALAMLNLPEKYKANKSWMWEFLHANGLSINEQQMRYKPYTKRAFRAVIKQKPLELLDVDLLSPIINVDYLKWINKNVKRSSWAWNVFYDSYNIRFVNRIHRELGIKDQRRQAWNAYRVIKPLELLLNKAKNWN